MKKDEALTKKQLNTIMHRKLVAIHYNKSEERLAYEEEYDFYLLLMGNGPMFPVEINGQTYYRCSRLVDTLQKISATDPTLVEVAAMLSVRARFNSHRDLAIYGIWLPKLWEKVLTGDEDLTPAVVEIIDKYKFSIGKFV